MELSGQEFFDDSEASDAFSSDESEEDPNFDVLEETRLTFSNLSVSRKSKGRIVKGKDERKEEEADVIEPVVPELDEQDQKSYESVQKMIKGGEVEKLKVEQCKIYLRRHGLRLSGNKATLIHRINEHIDILNGGGEKKYPASTFVLNCKGDACAGDVVMFEQNVYEMFNVASRSANGPPRGTRIVAGRIVKESYGSAKQQHTFTIEVLWSKGEKPLPPLHPLLIKGRNLYRLKTMRQKWEDEGEREKILSEKHARGGVARLNRETRIQQKENRKMPKPNRCEKVNKQQKEMKNTRDEQESEPKIKCSTETSKMNCPNRPENFLGKPGNISHLPSERIHQRRPLTTTNCFSRANLQHLNPNMNYRTAKSPIRGQSWNYFEDLYYMKGILEIPTSYENRRCNYLMIPPQGFGFRRNDAKMNFYDSRYLQESSWQGNYIENMNLRVQRQGGYERKQKCRYYARGMCHFGERCKYLHELAENKL